MGPDVKEPDPISVYVPDTTVRGLISNSKVDVRNLQIITYFKQRLVGNTSYSSVLKIEDWFSKAFSVPSYGRMLPDRESIKMIAVGGGLSAGAQNGGLYREGQLTAYPNLVAKQLGMIDFTTPVFDQAQSNGTGFSFFVKNSGSDPKFEGVSNNLGTEIEEQGGKPPVFSKYNGKVHNFSAPWLTRYTDDTWNASLIGKAVNGNNVSWSPPLPYLSRFIPQSYFERSTLFNYITETQQYNFFLLEDLNETFLNVLRLRGGRTIGYEDFIGPMPISLRKIQGMAKNGAKGVVFTVPRFKDLGVAGWGVQIISDQEIGLYETAVKTTNEDLKKWALEYDIAIVDLNSIYQKVNMGEYRLANGLLLDSRINGNFFSSDGIYPSVLGQAVIANEVIRAMNDKYEAKIPLINIETYLKVINFQY